MRWEKLSPYHLHLGENTNNQKWIAGIIYNIQFELECELLLLVKNN